MFARKYAHAVRDRRGTDEAGRVHRADPDREPRPRTEEPHQRCHEVEEDRTRVVEIDAERQRRRRRSTRRFVWRAMGIFQLLERGENSDN